MAEPLPQGVAEHLPAAIASVMARLEPATPTDLAGLMQRLWDGGVPQPHEATMTEWRRLLGMYPAGVLAHAFDQVARTHRWPDPPKIADVMRWVGDEHGRLLAWRRKLESAQLRANLDAKAAAEEAQRRRSHERWMAGLTPEQRANLDEMRERMARGESVASMIGMESVARAEEAM